MEYAAEGIVLLGMAINTILDLLKREISIWIVMVMGIAGAGCHLISGSYGLSQIGMGLIPGGIALMLSVLSKESIGYGDVWMLAGLGLALGIRQTVFICMIAVFLAGLTALVLLLVFRKGRKYEIPFAPFLLVGFICSVI